MIQDQRLLFENLQKIAQKYRSKNDVTRGYAKGVLEEIEEFSAKFKGVHTQLLEIVRENSVNMSDRYLLQFSRLIFIIKRSIN